MGVVVHYIELKDDNLSQKTVIFIRAVRTWNLTWIELRKDAVTKWL
jgi:hypothetical protein